MAGATVEKAENPLVEGLERLPVHPTTLVIFGGTGDLAKRKLLPAIYNLAHEGALPERFNLIASSRSDNSHEDYAQIAEDAIKQFSRREPDADHHRLAARALLLARQRRLHPSRARRAARAVRRPRGPEAG